MTQQRGFGAAKAVKEAMDQRRGAGGFTPNLVIKDGDVIELAFNGSGDEPLIAYEHTYKSGQDFHSEWCAKDAENHDGCVYCYYSERGDKRIGKPTARGVFNVVDTRWVHKVLNPGKTAKANGNARYDYLPCADDVSCKLCKQKVDRERQGQKVWKLAMQWVQTLGGVNEALGRRCMCGGKVKLTGYKYTNAKGRVIVTGDLPEGMEEDQAEKVLECTKCEEPTQRSIFNTLIQVTRTGGGTDTAYNFQPLVDDGIPEWVNECEPRDLEGDVKSKPADMQAEKLGVTNPFDKDRQPTTRSRGAPAPSLFDDE